MRLLVTAGATCEDIDDIRYLTNRSSGRMGFAVAAEAVRRGHEVDLIAGPVHPAVPEGVRFTEIRSARDLLEACRGIFPSCDAMVAAAAVGDYRPAERVAGKLKKGEGELVLRLVRNPDVAAELAGLKRPGQLVVGFALEATDIFESRSSAEAKMADKKQDLAVLNGPSAMGVDRVEVAFCTPEGGWTGPEVLDKAAVAARILDQLEARLKRRDEADSRGSP